MKRLVSPLLLVLILLSFSIGWRSTPPDAIISPVNMTLAGNRLFVSDRYTGLHVYDITNLSAPSKVIQIFRGNNAGAAVKGDIIYTNHYNQLQAIRITGESFEVVARIGEVYGEEVPWNEGPMGNDDYGYSCSCASSYDAAQSPGPSGGGSSYATFVLIDDYLYRVHDSFLIVYDVTNQEKPKEVSRVEVGWDIETLYPTQNFMFIGGQRGMYIFTRADPTRPRQIAKIEHARACDPVVVSGSTAFVTLRGGNRCGQAPDELLCVSIKDPSQPEVVATKPLQTPWGLAVQDNGLYVSHGENGYSLLDISQSDNPTIRATWADEATRDFLWFGNTLFVLGDDNVSIYDVTDPMAPRLLSKVEPEGTS